MSGDYGQQNQEFVPHEHWMPELHQPIFQPDMQGGLFALPNDSHAGVPQNPPMAAEPFVNPVGGHIPSMLHGHDVVAHSFASVGLFDLPQDPNMDISFARNVPLQHVDDFEPGMFQQHMVQTDMPLSGTMQSIHDGHDFGLAPLHTDQLFLPPQQTIDVDPFAFALPLAQPDLQIGSSMSSNMHDDVFGVGPLPVHTHVGLPQHPALGVEPYDHPMVQTDMPVSGTIQSIHDGHDFGLAPLHIDQLFLPPQQTIDVDPFAFAVPLAQPDLQIGSSMPSNMHDDVFGVGPLPVHTHVGLPQHPALGVEPYDHPMVQTDLNQEFVPHEHWMPELHQPIFQPDMQGGLFALPNDSHVGVPHNSPMATEPFVNPVDGHIPSMLHGHDVVANSFASVDHFDLPQNPAMDVEPVANPVAGQRSSMLHGHDFVAHSLPHHHADGVPPSPLASTNVAAPEKGLLDDNIPMSVQQLDGAKTLATLETVGSTPESSIKPPVQDLAVATHHGVDTALVTATQPGELPTEVAIVKLDVGAALLAQVNKPDKIDWEWARAASFMELKSKKTMCTFQETVSTLKLNLHMQTYHGQSLDTKVIHMAGSQDTTLLAAVGLS